MIVFFCFNNVYASNETNSSDINNHPNSNFNDYLNIQDILNVNEIHSNMTENISNHCKVSLLFDEYPKFEIGNSFNMTGEVRSCGHELLVVKININNQTFTATGTSNWFYYINKLVDPTNVIATVYYR